MNAAPASRRFRPRGWAALLTLVFAALTIHLGHWQGDRARYKIDQQATLDAASSAPAMNLESLVRNAANDKGQTFRYRTVKLSAEFDATGLLFVDNKIQDGKAGYAVLQLARADATSPAGSATKHVLIDRGWVAADNDRSKLPQLETPNGRVDIVGRINLPISRNPGTRDNNANEVRINYVNIDEIAKRFNVSLEPYLIEQTQGAGFLNTPRAAPSANYQKNRAYQVQWYAFAALAVVLFIALSFRREKT